MPERLHMRTDASCGSWLGSDRELAGGLEDVEVLEQGIIRSPAVLNVPTARNLPEAYFTEFAPASSRGSDGPSFSRVRKPLPGWSQETCRLLNSVPRLFDFILPLAGQTFLRCRS